MPKPPTARETLLNAAIGQRLRDARHSLHPSMSSQTLGHHLGISYQATLKYETGASHITASRPSSSSWASRINPKKPPPNHNTTKN